MSLLSVALNEVKELVELSEPIGPLTVAEGDESGDYSQYEEFDDSQ